MNVLITGGVGFIGRYLTKELSEKGYNVKIIDNLHRWSKEEIKYPVIWEDLEGMTTVADITDKKVINELIQKNDIIIHLSAISRVMESIKNPNLTYYYNIYGTYLIVESCKKYKKPIIFSSSREVYGSAKYFPVDLKHPLNPINPYAASKISGESIIKAFSNSYNLEYFIFRIANVYGIGDKERVIPIFLDKALKNDPIEIYGTQKLLDFIYIDDVVNAFIKVIENFDDIKNNTVNLGSGVGVTILELANIIKKLTNSTSEIRLLKNRSGEVDKFYADITKTIELLNWKPKTKLKEGLKEVIKYSLRRRESQ